MRALYTFLFVFAASIAFAQNPGDTIFIETFNYTQTHGGGIRDTMIDFPDDPGVTYEKIIMMYNMRCKNGLISTTTDRNKGCGEWDYSCNTYIHDSTKVDSLLSYTSSHTISSFSGNTYRYVENPTFDYYQYRQKEVTVNNIISETSGKVGAGTLPIFTVLDASQHSGKSQYLYLASELSAAGLSAGDLDGILLDITATNAEADYLKVSMKNSPKTELNSNTPDLDGFTEVYFRDHAFNTGSERLQFHTPFVWDGTSNLIVEFSFTNDLASSSLIVEGEVTTPTVSGIYANNGTSLNSFNGEIDVPTESFSNISDEITISFWSNGNAEVQPVNTSFVHGLDANGDRSVNLHLPWSNSGIYWDCGNEGGSYDRIDKTASPEEYKGQWNHWAATKNATSGEMKLYLNGELWQSGEAKNRIIDIQDFIIGSRQGGQYYYFGKMDEVRVWDKELSEQTIANWMYKPLEASHPDYANLVAYYKIDEGSGNVTMDSSVHGKTGSINGYMYWVYERGDQLNHGFTEVSQRPNITFVQGDYNLTVTDVIVTDEVKHLPNIVREYEVIPRWGTLKHDSLNQVSVNEYWEEGYAYTFDPEGIKTDSLFVTATDSISPTELTYFRRFPMKFEIISFVTPYGIWLDLGMEGKTWQVDVSDYAPVLKGMKRMTVERGGQWQEDMDIQFAFIVGTPPQDVLDVQQLWRPDASNYTNILNDRTFEARDVKLRSDASNFKIRSTITGHGQQGEFIGRYHNLSIDGEETFSWRVWTECSGNAVYPQGGTWIYDRAGWCPGQESDLYEYIISSMVTPGEIVNIDYSVETASGDSRYIVNNQLVSYDSPNFTLDAAITHVLRPNAADAINDRFNPACSFPEIVIRNTGATTLTSLSITYYEEGGESEEFLWSGSLEFMQEETVVLPIDDISFWMPNTNKFVATISNPNGGEDEYPENNTYTTFFEGTDVYPENQLINIVCKTNNYGYQTNYVLYDGEGDVFLEWDDLDNNTVYETPLILSPGCYQLKINDLANDGLEFWANPNQGAGYFQLKDSDGTTLYNFEPDFGGFAIHEFGIGNITSVNQIDDSFAVATFPNPSLDLVNVHLSGVKHGKYDIQLLNAMNVIVYDRTITVSENEFKTVLNIENLPSGVYLLQVVGESNRVSRKVIKK